jgi:ABC-type antimicrobial peptide transport system permease subunit
MIFTIFAVFIAGVDSINGNGLLSSIVFAVFPLVLALAFVFPASLIIGLPLTAVLRRIHAESSMAYVCAGIVVGFILPWAALAWRGAVEGWWLAIIGAFSGAVTGRTWWVEARDPLVR